MFESRPDARLRPRFRADPWASQFGSALGFETGEEDEEETLAAVETDVETADWSAPRSPRAVPPPARTVFVDGVQRVDLWGQWETGDAGVEAALASVAVGAAICADEGASLRLGPTARVLALSGGRTGEKIVVPAGRLDLVFEPEHSATPGRKGVSDAISLRRSALERGRAEALVDAASLVVLDGRLSFDPAAAARVVGLTKTIQKRYLPDAQWQLLARLGAGERTPVFRIAYGDTTRYSWYLRLPHTRPIHHALAGVVRLETPEVGVEAAVALADLTACHLPRFASRPEHDPRAPQNLLPVGALERRLRHEMGDPAWVRRLIEDHLHREAAS